MDVKRTMGGVQANEDESLHARLISGDRNEEK